MKKMMQTWLCVGMLLTMAACGGSIKVDLKENIEIEYGSDPKIEDLTQQEGITLKEVKEYDAKKIGEQEITVIFALGDETQEEKVKVNVKDTKAPEITFKSETVEITLGDSFDASANIESVKDPVDGDIKQSTDNTITKDGYFTTSDIKSEVGEYTVTVTAFDKNGNKAERTYKLIIKEKQAESENQPVSSNQGGSSQAPTQNGGTQSQVPASNGSNASSSQPAPSQPKVVCPNGNEPIDPNLPCDAWHPIGIDQCYRDVNGNIVVFPSSQAAYDWAWNEVLNNPEIAQKYSSYVTTPIAKNDGTEYYGITFLK